MDFSDLKVTLAELQQEPHYIKGKIMNGYWLDIIPKDYPTQFENYGVTELELTGLLANIHGFEQKLNNNYFEAIVDHKAIDYLIKSKHEPTSTD